MSYSVYVFVVVVDAGYSLFRRSPGGGTSVHRLCWLKLLAVVYVQFEMPFLRVRRGDQSEKCFMRVSVYNETVWYL